MRGAEDLANRGTKASEMRTNHLRVVETRTWLYGELTSRLDDPKNIHFECFFEVLSGALVGRGANLGGKLGLLVRPMLRIDDPCIVHQHLSTKA